MAARKAAISFGLTPRNKGVAGAANAEIKKPPCQQGKAAIKQIVNSLTAPVID